MSADPAGRSDVVVVGGGPVGGALALAAADAGLQVTVLDPEAEPPRHDPRVFAISRASQRFLESVGVWGRLSAEARTPYEFMQVWEQGEGLAFNAAELGEADLGHMVDAGALRRAVDQALESRAELVYLRGWRPTASEIADGRRRLRASDGDSDAGFDAALVVGTDGARSPLRGLVDIDVTVRDYGQRAVVTHVRCEPADATITAWQRFLPDGTLAMLPTAPGRFGVVWSMDEARARAFESGEPSDLLAAMDEAMEGRPGRVVEITAEVGGFPLQFLRAERYVAERLALAGDAAQVVHPLAGLGLNIGLADAAALVQVLVEAGVDADPGEARTLARYQRWRMGESRAMGHALDTLQRVFVNQRPGMSALRRFGLSAVDRLIPVKNTLARRALGV